LQRPCTRNDRDIWLRPVFLPTERSEGIVQSARRYPPSGGRTRRGTGATCLSEVKAHARDQVKTNVPLSTAMYCGCVHFYGVRMCGGRVCVVHRMSTVSIEKRVWRASNASKFPKTWIRAHVEIMRPAGLRRPSPHVKIHLPAPRRLRCRRRAQTGSNLPRRHPRRGHPHRGHPYRSLHHPGHSKHPVAAFLDTNLHTAQAAGRLWSFATLPLFHDASLRSTWTRVAHRSQPRGSRRTIALGRLGGRQYRPRASGRWSETTCL